MTKEKIFLIILLAIVCIFSAIVINNKLSENIDTVLYQKAINLYQTEEYGQAYSQFSKISRFSDLKAAALFRQARCATILGDTQAAIKSYSILLKRYKKSSLYPIAEYNLAVLLYECGSKKDGIEEGSKEKQIEIAKSMLADGMEIELISKYTNLTVDFINSLKEIPQELLLEEVEDSNIPLLEDKE